MVRDKIYEKALLLVEKQKALLAKREAKIASLRGEFNGMRHLATAKNVEIEQLKYKLQINRDEVRKMAEALNLNAAEITRLKAVEETYAKTYAKICSENTQLRNELEVAKRQLDDPYFASLQEIVKQTCTRVRNLEGRQTQELLLTGLHDLNVRVGRLEASQWQEDEVQ